MVSNDSGDERVCIMEGLEDRAALAVHSVEQLLMIQKLFERESYVPRDLTKQEGRNIVSRMKWNRSKTAVRVLELFVESPLAHLNENNFTQDCNNFL